MNQYLKTFFKGMAMGAADVIPGVSGGTIAFITGIYDTLLESIRRVNPSIFGLWKKQGLNAVLTHINAKFLIAVFGGIITSIFTLARLITWLLETHPIPLWSFFFGLIIISVIFMLRQVEKWQAFKAVVLIIGAIFAWTITIISPITLEPTNINILFGGALAICAMILPGISGSFILLLLGLYGPVIGAVKAFDGTTLLLFLSGCIIGLLSFSHLLSWLLKHARDYALCFLTGLMVGTLGKMWPWKEVLTWRTNSKGVEVPLVEQNLMPHTFEQVTGQPALIGWAVIAMVAGIVIVGSLELFADKDHDKK
ncbi:DUF368 domain-containing protein [Vibrio sp. SS-MA-C1-2]|uniref:DUF368 domain-containing protein n=1 Tax=Vibrio sp. SS-MA-C1-2 TaxID=2908646 RepID=UPI001F36D15E|nr:DUF368 domain-containing protein [Vibrio sp. SS-MA-C1-2]UJF17397.1 DUF368 domain-containing protein [Vibrio sp. SS-MA-C1-2]